MPKLKKNPLTSTRFTALSKKYPASFNWKSDKDKGVVFENRKLGISIRYYAICDEKKRVAYDTIGIRERSGNSVVVVVNEEGRIGLLHEYRPMPDKRFIACVRGFADRKEGGLKTALREFLEETERLKVVKTSKLGKVYQNTTFFEVPINVFLLEVRSSSDADNGIRKDDHEQILRMEFYEESELLRMIRSNKIQCQMTLAALMLYFSMKKASGLVAK